MPLAKECNVSSQLALEALAVLMGAFASGRSTKPIVVEITELKHIQDCSWAYPQ